MELRWTSDTSGTRPPKAPNLPEFLAPISVRPCETETETSCLVYCISFSRHATFLPSVFPSSRSSRFAVPVRTGGLAPSRPCSLATSGRSRSGDPGASGDHQELRLGTPGDLPSTSAEGTVRGSRGSAAALPFFAGLLSPRQACSIIIPTTICSPWSRHGFNPTYFATADRPLWRVGRCFLSTMNHPGVWALSGITRSGCARFLNLQIGKSKPPTPPQNMPGSSSLNGGWECETGKHSGCPFGAVFLKGPTPLIRPFRPPGMALSSRKPPVWPRFRWTGP